MNEPNDDPGYRWQYRGESELVHIPDGKRAAFGQHIAEHIAEDMRKVSYQENGPTYNSYSKPLCPGCYMVALFNAAVFLARDSGQSLAELGRTMSAAFAQLVDCKDGDEACIESIAVKLDEGKLS